MEREVHILREARVPANRWVEAEVEVAPRVSEVETEGTEEGDISTKMSGVQNGRMSIVLYPSSPSGLINQVVPQAIDEHATTSKLQNDEG